MKKENIPNERASSGLRSRFKNLDLREWGRIKTFKAIKLNRRKILQFAFVAVLVALGFYFSRPAVVTVFNGYAANEKALPIYCVDIPDKKVAISFDAAWGADDTDTLLSTLDKHQVKATFFLCGYWVEKYPEEVKKIYAAGHDIGNHGNTHAHGAQLSLEQNKKEIMDAHQKVKDLLGIDMNLYRPPFGEYNNTVIEAAKQCNYHTIQWDIDSHDWMAKGPTYEINRVLNHKHLGSGSIVLFHNNAKYTPQTLDTIITGLKDKGYELVPISKLIYTDNYFMDLEGRQKQKSQ